MQYADALSIFGQSLTVDLSDRRFLLTVVDPEIMSEDILVRLELSFLSDLSVLQAGAEGGKFESLKSGRISASLLFDWGLLTESNAREFVRFCQNWDAGKYYAKGGQRERVLVNAGILHGDLTEFIGPNNVACAGLVRVRIEGGRLSFGGSSPEAKAFIKSLLKEAAPSPKAENLLF